MARTAAPVSTARMSNRREVCFGPGAVSALRIPSLTRRACMGTTLHPSPQRKQGNAGSGPLHVDRFCRFRYVPASLTAACSCAAEAVIARAKPAMNRAEPDGVKATIEKSPSWNQSAAKGNFSRYAWASEE